MSAEIENRADIVNDKVPENIEFQHEPGIADIIRAVALNPETVLTVKCGSLSAQMHLKHFACPGIHQPCIVVDGETQMITPKSYTVKANKDKQKDWKGSIRIGRTNLRTLMETKALDFFDHVNFCSSKCQSRNYLPSKEKTEPSFSRRSSLPNPKKNALRDVLLQTQRSSDGDLKFKNCLASIFPSSEENGLLFKNPFITQLEKIRHADSASAYLSTAASPSSSLVQSAMTIGLHSTSPEIKIEGEDDPNEQSTSFAPVHHHLDNTKLINQMFGNPTEFWGEMVDSGLSDSIVDQMIITLNNLRNKINCVNTSKVAAVLSRTIASLGISHKVETIVRGGKKLSKVSGKKEPSLIEHLSRKRPPVALPEQPVLKIPRNNPSFGLSDNSSFVENFTKQRMLEKVTAALRKTAPPQNGKTFAVPPAQMALLEQLKSKLATETNGPALMNPIKEAQADAHLRSLLRNHAANNVQILQSAVVNEEPDPEMPCLESVAEPADVASTSTAEEVDFSTAFLMQSNPNQSYTEMLMHLG